MRVLVTGAAGMIGSHLVSGLLKSGHDVIGLDLKESGTVHSRYTHKKSDLGDINSLRGIFRSSKADRVIHLAALAHTSGENDLSYDRYHHINVECAANIFTAACENNVPILFISTVDVFGFTTGTVSTDAELKPVSNYGRSKAEAEAELKRICGSFKMSYTIFRLSPVYTSDIKRDIQKRYYLKYPNIAYVIGKGTEYEVLNIDNAVKAMVDWLGMKPAEDIKIIKDPVRLNTAEILKLEKSEGRANVILHFPEWTVRCGYAVIRKITGENDKTYLLNKAVYPLRTR